MALIAVAEHGPLREPREAAGELRAIFVEQVGRELVDGDDDEEFWRGQRLRGRLGRETGRRGGEDQFAHWYSAYPCEGRGPDALR